MKKLFAFFLAVALLSTLVPFSAFRVSAGNGVQAKIDQLLAVYPTGSYFTTTGKPHYMLDPSICPSDCGVCQLQNQNPNKLGGLPAGYETGLSGWQCWAFANYAFYHIFGYYGRSFESCPKVNLTNAKLGDIVSFTLSGFPHYGVYLYTSGSNVVVYDGNGDYYCGVRYGSSYSASAVNAVYRAPNYDEVNGSTPTPTPQPTYTDITPGTYAVKNNNTGTYMCVSYGADNNLQNVDMYSEINGASRMVITKASTGYKIRPECSASRLVNPYGYTVTSGLNVNIYNDENDSTQWWQFQKVSGGYVIRNVQNPDCVLDTDGGNVFVSSYTGASTQIWSLISTASLATPTISFDKSSYTLGEAVNISWTASPAGSNLSHYWISIVDPNGKEVVGNGLGSSATSYKFTPSSAGTYSVKVYATPVGSQSGEGSLTDTKSFTILSPHTHSYSSWKTRNAATCSSNGTEYRTCSCGAEETRTISALGHNYTGVITKPTCTSGGYTTYTCSRCSHSYTGNSTSAMGHTPGSAATCTSAQLCTTCGTTITAAMGHDEGKWEILGDGSEERRCTKCGHLLETVPAPKPNPVPEDPPVVEPEIVLGDVNNDGIIDQFDYILVKRHYFATRLLADDEITRADINVDGAIDQFDYILIKRIYFGTFTIG